MGKGQVAIFVSIGIILVIGVSSFFIIRQTPSIIPGGQKTNSLESHTNSCLEKTASAGLALSAKQGMIFPKAFLASDDAKIAYYYFKGRDLVPAEESVERELESYINENIDTCLYNLAGNILGIRTEGLPKTKADIEQDKVAFRMTYKIRSDESSMEEANTTIKSSYYNMLKLAGRIVKGAVNDPEWIDLEEVSQSAFGARLIKVDSSTLVYELSDPEGLDGAPLIFRFGMKYRFGK